VFYKLVLYLFRNYSSEHPVGRFLKKTPQKLSDRHNLAATPCGRSGEAVANWAYRKHWQAGIFFKTCLSNFSKVWPPAGPPEAAMS